MLKTKKHSNVGLFGLQTKTRLFHDSSSCEAGSKRACLIQWVELVEKGQPLRSVLRFGVNGSEEFVLR